MNNKPNLATAINRLGSRATTIITEIFNRRMIFTSFTRTSTKSRVKNKRSGLTSNKNGAPSPTSTALTQVTKQKKTQTLASNLPSTSIGLSTSNNNPTNRQINLRSKTHIIIPTRNRIEKGLTSNLKKKRKISTSTLKTTQISKKPKSPGGPISNRIDTRCKLMRREGTNEQRNSGNTPLTTTQTSIRITASTRRLRTTHGKRILWANTDKFSKSKTTSTMGNSKMLRSGLIARLTNRWPEDRCRTRTCSRWSSQAGSSLDAW